MTPFRVTIEIDGSDLIAEGEYTSDEDDVELSVNSIYLPDNRGMPILHPGTKHPIDISGILFEVSGDEGERIDELVLEALRKED